MQSIEEINAQWEGTLIDTLGIKFSVTQEDHTFLAHMPVTPQICQPYGILHGGATLALAESLAGYGSMTLCKEEEMPCGQQVGANHLHGAKIGEIVKAKASLLHKGRTTHVWNVDVINENGRLISTIRITNFIKKLHSCKS